MLSGFKPVDAETVPAAAAAGAADAASLPVWPASFFGTSST